MGQLSLVTVRFRDEVDVVHPRLDGRVDHGVEQRKGCAIDQAISSARMLDEHLGVAEIEFHHVDRVGADTFRDALGGRKVDVSKRYVIHLRRVGECRSEMPSTLSCATEH